MIGYGDPPPQWSQENQGTCDSRGDYAYMVNFNPDVVPRLANLGFLSVCAKAFTRMPVELDLPLMTATEKDTRNCEDYMAKGYAWEQMRGLSGLLLHEFLHWNNLVTASGADLSTVVSPQENVYLGDFNSQKTAKGCDPPSGYGYVFTIATAVGRLTDSQAVELSTFAHCRRWRSYHHAAKRRIVRLVRP